MEWYSGAPDLWTAVTHSVVVSPFMPHATHVMASFRTGSCHGSSSY